MKKTKVEIRLDSHGHGSLVVDGTDIASEVSGLYLSAAPGREPELTVSLARLEVAAMAGVRVSAAAEAALVALGWTPPAMTKKEGSSH